MIKRLIKIYTPFVCALSALIHGVLYFVGYKGCLYYVLNNVTGHSFLLILYIIATSSKMCIWYRITNYLLMYIHVFNTLNVLGFLGYKEAFNISIAINTCALISFLTYRITAGVTKILC